MSVLVRDVVAVVVRCEHGLRAPVRPVARLLGGSGVRQVGHASVQRVTCALLAPSHGFSQQVLPQGLEAVASVAVRHAPCGTAARQMSEEQCVAFDDVWLQACDGWPLAKPSLPQAMALAAV